MDELQIGDRVTSVTQSKRPDKGLGTVESWMVVGKRHPGRIYTIRLDDGGMYHAPAGVLSRFASAS